MTVKILQFPVGPLEMNATLVMDIESKETIFFDPGDGIENILSVADKEEMKITRLIATHCHIDHIAGSNEAMDKLQLKLEISPLRAFAYNPLTSRFSQTSREVETCTITASS